MNKFSCRDYLLRLRITAPMVMILYFRVLHRTFEKTPQWCLGVSFVDLVFIVIRCHGASGQCLIPGDLIFMVT